MTSLNDLYWMHNRSNIVTNLKVKCKKCIAGTHSDVSRGSSDAVVDSLAHTLYIACRTVSALALVKHIGGLNSSTL